MIRVLLVDDHTLVRTGLRLLVETIPDVEVVGEAADGLEALRMIASLRPDCALMDLAMPGLSGLDAVKRATVAYPNTRILVVSMHAEEAYVQQAIVAGAAGYVLKGSDKAELERALRAVSEGQTYLTPAISKAVVAALTSKAAAVSAASPLAALTPRQLEVLRLVAEGKPTKQIAATLGLSTKTVEAHRGALAQRLGIRDLAGLIRFAIREGVVRSDR
jgi:DNA-binding NarL/FixJ family response regulator